MLFDLNKDYIFQNVLCFIFLLIIINKLNITLKHIYSFIIVIILWYIYYYTNNNNKIHSEKINYIQKFIEGTCYYNNNDKFINFIYDNRRFEHTKNYTELINIINIFLKVYSELKKNFISQKLDNCRDMYKNALNTYQSLIYSISIIDNNYQTNLHRLDNIFKIYLSNLKHTEKENYNVKNINNSSRPYDENLIEGNNIKNENTFNIF
jgi:hypothetical protein